MTTVIKHIFVFLTFSILLASCACNDTNNYSREQLEAKPFELYANTTRDLLVGTWIKDTGERKFVIGENDIKAFNKKDEGWERDYGDEYYDWAKLYYSIVGNYDQFNNKKFILDILDDEVKLSIDSSGYDCLAEYYLELIPNCNIKKIKLFLRNTCIFHICLVKYQYNDKIYKFTGNSI